MSREIHWAALAELDLDTIEDFIAEDKPRAAIDTVDTIEETVLLLKVFPEMGKQGRVSDTRELVIPRLPYIVVYRLQGEMVEIIRVLHGARPWP